ncbi:hypothetical protein CP8484711_1637B, partial [Chlamydia psittaci 84-8471/1]
QLLTTLQKERIKVEEQHNKRKKNHQFLGLPTLQMSILFASRITGSA